MAKPVDIDRLVTALTMLLKPPRLISSDGIVRRGRKAPFKLGRKRR
jgi:hypothetical protein